MRGERERERERERKVILKHRCLYDENLGEHIMS
jgi:hypothetical protein